MEGAVAAVCVSQRISLSNHHFLRVFADAITGLMSAALVLWHVDVRFVRQLA